MTEQRLHLVLLEANERESLPLMQEATMGVPGVKVELIPPDPSEPASDEDIQKALTITDTWVEQTSEDGLNTRPAVSARLKQGVTKGTLLAGGVLLVLRGPQEGDFASDFRDRLGTIVEREFRDNPAS